MNTYNITGKAWNMEKKWYPWDDQHKYPHFESEDETKFTVEANSMLEAYKWMLETHPELSVGCGITCENNSDFLFDAVFDYYYALGMRSIDEVVKHNLQECIRQLNGDMVSA